MARKVRRWIRDNLFQDWFNGALTIVTLALLAVVTPPIIRWALLEAAWSGGPEVCRDTTGACWAVVTEKFRTLMVGIYPVQHLWRPIAAAVLVVAAVAYLVLARPSALRMLLVGLLLPLPLMWLIGGGFGLAEISRSMWGGLMLSMLLALIGVAVSVPLGILLALARRSQYIVLRSIAVGIIEPVRGVPLIAILFMASIMLPLLLPRGLQLESLLRIQFGIILFSSAYMAEVVRGGLQAIPGGQIEAAKALGLGYWRVTLYVVLPQALRIVVPPLIGRCIALFKDTSLVIIVGLLDFLGMARLATRDISWQGYDAELFLFCALVYWAICYGMSRYGRSLQSARGGPIHVPQ